MSRIARILAVLLLIAAPFGEGGRAPLSLVCLHTLALGLALVAAWRCLVMEGGRPAGPGSGLLLLPGAAFAWSCLAATQAVYPYAAWLGILDRSAAVAALFAAVILLGNAADLVLIRNTVVASTAVQSVVALAFATNGGPAEAARIFVNRNHLAAYLNIGLLLCVAATEEALRGGPRRRVLAFGGLVALHLAALLPLQSRGALLGLALALALMIALRWSRWPAAARVSVATAALLALLAGGLLIQRRFEANADPDRYRRLDIWRATTDMIGSRPLLGFGPGSFPHEAPRHNFARRIDPVRYGRQFSGAHSAVLTAIAEDGLPAAAVALGWVIGGSVLLLRRRRPDATSAVTEGVGLAIAALLAQGLVEDLQERPAIILTAALLLGSAVASTRRFTLRTVVPVSRPGSRLAVAALTTLAVTVLLTGVLLPYTAYREAARARAAGRAGLPAMRRAARLDPANAEYHLDLAMAALNSGPPTADRYAEAADELHEARRRSPGDPRFPLLLGRLEARAARSVFVPAGAGVAPGDGDGDGDGAGAGAAPAARLYEAAVELAPLDPRPRLEQAGFLLDSGEPDQAVASLNAALKIEPHYRRARILLAATELRIGRVAEARNAWDTLLASDSTLKGYTPDSPYAAEIVADEPRERAAFTAALAALPEALRQAPNR